MWETSTYFHVESEMQNANRAAMIKLKQRDFKTTATQTASWKQEGRAESSHTQWTG